MPTDLLIITIVVAVCSIFQSIFGMGILVFGTPTMLVIGYDFATSLCYLLPASCAVSFLQVVTARSNKVQISPYLYFVCLPSICVGLSLTRAEFLGVWINLLVGTALLFTAATRTLPFLRDFFKTFLEKYSFLYHAVMGLVHGLTNLGGGLLAILASGTQTEKMEIRYTIALYYLAFSIVQMLILVFVLGKMEELLTNASIALISILIYVSIGNRLFGITSNKLFNIALTTFVALYGLAVLIKI